MRPAGAAALLGCAAAASGACNATAARKDCGFSGIDETGCERKGCCWSPVNPNPSNLPWCFFPDGGPTPAPGPKPPVPPMPPGTTCSLPNSDKTDCLKGDKASCEGEGCCWKPVDPNPGNVPWCFHPDLPPPPTPKPTPAPPLPPGVKPFTDDELSTMQGFFFKNIDLFGTGMVVAAPDNGTKGGSYWFHWMRDAGLTMRCVLDNFPWETAKPKMESYVKHVMQAQTEKDPNGINVLGEPKFMIPSGTVFTGGWCRPQNDGAGIRGGTLGLFALKLLATGDKGDADYVSTYLWGKSGGAVPRDLDYCAQVWDQTGCDLWEEVRSDDFYWQWASCHRGLRVGVELANKVGDSASAAKYGSLADKIQARMKAQVAADGNYIFESKIRQKDVAALLGALHDDPANPAHGLGSPEVANTIATLDSTFTAMFPINSAGAKLWGRYEGDGYAGGNPWVLACFGKAQALYRGATALLSAADSAHPAAVAAWARVATGWRLSQNASAVEVAQALADSGDQVLVRMRGYVSPLGFHLPEQIDKETGKLANVHDLTWSYAALFDAMGHRSKFFDALTAHYARAH